jgi:D-alanyl-D-alanine carboxypeptidase
MIRATGLLGLLAFYPAAACADERYAAIVQDLRSGQVLFSRAADEPRFPASLTKMMTLYVLFQELQRGRMSLRTPLAASPVAEAQPRTKLGLRAGETITVEDSVKALVTHSANDVAVVVAENVAGSEAQMADRMTRTAQALGMTRTQFTNASGLPDPSQYSTARDMLLLGAALKAHFPQYFHYFRTRSFAFRGRTFRSHNRLVGGVEGVDGIKTGYIRSSGFNVVSSVNRNGRSLIAVVMGGTSAKSRDAHVRALLAAHISNPSSSATVAGPQAVTSAEE